MSEAIQVHIYFSEIKIKSNHVKIMYMHISRILPIMSPKFSKIILISLFFRIYHVHHNHISGTQIVHVLTIKFKYPCHHALCNKFLQLYFQASWTSQLFCQASFTQFSTMYLMSLYGYMSFTISWLLYLSNAKQLVNLVFLIMFLVQLKACLCHAPSVILPEWAR